MDGPALIAHTRDEEKISWHRIARGLNHLNYRRDWMLSGNLSCIRACVWIVCRVIRSIALSESQRSW